MNNNINFIFFGTPDVASETLEILKQAGFLPSMIVTSPDAKSGRGLQMQASPVAIFAEKNKIPCLKPEKLEELGNVFMTYSQTDEPRKAIFQQENKNISQFDLFLVVAYGKIMPEKLINMPRLGSINIHYSLLPKYRGASPVESAILNGDKETGITIQKMKFKMDAGSIIAQEKVKILPDEKAPELRKRLIKIGGELLVKTLPEFLSGKIRENQQNEKQASNCKKIKKEDGLIDLNDDAIKNYNKFRAYALWPRTFFLARQSLGEEGFKIKRIIITEAVLENNQFVIKKVLPEGKKEIKYEEFKRM